MNVPSWKIELLRAPEGETGTGEATGDGAPPADGQATDATPPAGDTGPDFSFVGADFRGEDGNPDFAAFGTHYQDLLADKQARDEALALVPENGEYSFAVPEDFDTGIELPEGMRIELDASAEDMKPIFGELGAFLKEHNLPGDAAPKVMGMLQKYEATKAARGVAAAQAEYEKLGPNDATRDAVIGKVQRAVENLLPEAQAKAVMALTRSFDGVKALETLLQPRSAGSAPRTPAQKTVGQQMADYYSNPSA